MTEQQPPAAPPRPEPPQSGVTAPFWDATRRRQFLLQWCIPCDRAVFYPRDVCPQCLCDELEWRPASGRGSVYAVTVEQRPRDPRLASRAPYAVALIDLEEGVRVMSNVVGCAPEDVTAGMVVTVTWEPLSDGRMLPQFEPVRG